jgi:lactate dehydrogenase-like 2-hydroxyacid dehydrogenase
MSQKPLVIFTPDLPEDWIGTSLKECRVITRNDQSRGISSHLKKYLGEVEGILCLLDDPIPGEVIRSATHLKVISNMAVGVDNIDIETCTELGIPVGNTPGVLTDGTADLTLALLLAVCRKLIPASQDAMEGRWSNWDPTGWLGVDLKDATVGIIGLGKIGTAVAERLIPFGCKLIFTNRSPQPNKAKQLGADQVNLNDLLKRSDIICLHVPLNDETNQLINQEKIELMKPGVILINAARGAVVKNQALIAALQSGKIRAAGLDVTDPEPLPPDHILYKLDNCLITPHIGSATYNTRKTMAKIAINNLLAGLEGKPLVHCVNPEVYS